jgi:hypothetical protein
MLSMPSRRSNMAESAYCHVIPFGIVLLLFRLGVTAASIPTGVISLASPAMAFSFATKGLVISVKAASLRKQLIVAQIVQLPHLNVHILRQKAGVRTHINVRLSARQAAMAADP